MQKGPARHLRVGDKAAVHHHGIMRGVGKHLQQRHGQQDPAVIGPCGPRCRDNRPQIKAGRHDQRHKGDTENHEEHDHLHHIGAQRGT